MPGFYEFFAGGGMVRAGLGGGWTCLFANDFDARKGLTYQANWGTRGELTVGDIHALDATALPGLPDLAWASFPCQDLSLAGNGAGLAGARSGTFYAFWSLMDGLCVQGRAPPIVAVENVCGALTSRGGADFHAVCRTFVETGYRFGVLVINADLFTPQSRPRLFVVGVRRDARLPDDLTAPAPMAPFHPPAVVRAIHRLPDDLRDQAIWWNLPTPPRRTATFADLIEETPDSVTWHSPQETERLLSLMSPVNRAKVQAAQRAGRRMVGGVYRRTRTGADGLKVQRAEVRFDEVAGCLRTPAGGSSRQSLLIVDGPLIRSRLISPREAARLMGLADSYVLPPRYSDAYHLTGDGVVVPVARHLAEHLFEPLIRAQSGRESVPHARSHQRKYRP